MNPLKQKKGIFFLLLACLGQILMLLSCTLWKGILFVPTAWKRPPLEQDYWFWLLDEYVPPVPYEDRLLSLYFNLEPLFVLCLFAGLLWLFWTVYRKNRRGLLFFFGVLAVTAMVFFLLIAWLRQYGQPYHLYMDVASESWLLSLDVLLLLLAPIPYARRKKKLETIPL